MNIVTELKKIMQAVYGEEVRGSIHDAILKCWGNSDATLRKVENAQKKAAASAESAISSEQNAQAAKDATQQLANTIEDKKGERGESGTTTPTNGFINLEVDADGNLYAIYPDTVENVVFELDADGNLSYEVKDV